MDEFAEKVIDQAKRASTVAAQCKTEQAVNMFLVLPFIGLLGYDDRNPLEVCPEHHADFSDKYKNRVDFAILKDGNPIIAIESKQCGAELKDDRGQLRSYFNAAPSVKMGVLTDGLIFEFYADSDQPNMMDQSAFLVVDLIKISKGHIEDSIIEGLKNLQKSKFDPENIGAEAKRKLIFNNLLVQLDILAENPSEEFVRMMLQNAGMSHLRKKSIEEFTPVLQEAFREFINLRILKRLSLEPPAKESQAEKPAPAIAEISVDPRIVTTEVEIGVFQYVKQRLAFLIKSDDEFQEISKIGYKDYQGKFVVFYEKERKGRLFDFIEGSTGSHKFIFPDSSEISTDNFANIDAKLLSTFEGRVAEMKK